MLGSVSSFLSTIEWPQVGNEISQAGKLAEGTIWDEREGGLTHCSSLQVTPAWNTAVQEAACQEDCPEDNERA